MYQHDGYICAALTNPDRYAPAHRSGATSAHATPEHAAMEEKLAADGTFFYCGRYEIDVKREQIIHLPEVASKPAYVGSRQVRPYRFEGDRLILSDVEKDDPAVARWEIIWEKVG
jgi:Lipocalin-like domain